MKRSRETRVGLLMALSLCAGCGGGPPTRPQALTSGRTIRVISVGQMHFQKSGPALVLSYQTDLKIDQAAELRREVTEVWRDFRKEAERSKMAAAIIMVNEVPTGRFIQQGRSYNFVFERKPDGTWPQEPPAMREGP